MMDFTGRIPLDLFAAQEHQLTLKIVLIPDGGILLSVDNTPHSFSPEVEHLEKKIHEILVEAFALVGKEDISNNDDISVETGV